MSETCPNVAEHTPSPNGYLAWHYWADRMGRNHRQKRCPGCNLYTIWTPGWCAWKNCPCHQQAPVGSVQEQAIGTDQTGTDNG